MSDDLNGTLHDLGALPLPAAFGVHDDLLGACNDLDRLHGLLAHAGAELSAGFHDVFTMVAQRRGQGLRAGADEAFLAALEQRLAGAVTALQFEDMATQLVRHTHQVLRSAADRLAAEAFGDDDSPGVVEATPSRPNPVTQDERDAGSIELF